MTEPLRPWGANFGPKEIALARGRKGLLSMEIELSRACNLRCVYCYASSGAGLEGELSFDEITGAVDQAVALGARRIIVIGGGEPLLYPRIGELLDLLRARDVEIDLFTNATLITPAWARRLFDLGVSLVVKRNSETPRVQDALAGKKGTFRAIERGMALLREAGYPAPGRHLGIETIICRQNIAELPGMWVRARDAGIVPYFEMITWQGRAREQDDLWVTSAELRELFTTLSRIDRERYGFEWEPHPPIAALNCNRHEYSCLLTSSGDIQPCTGVEVAVGNIRRSSLRDILAGSPVMEEMRNVRGNLKGACKGCPLTAECYGCRGLAYHVTGDMFAADPLCWMNPDAPAPAGEGRRGGDGGDGA